MYCMWKWLALLTMTKIDIEAMREQLENIITKSVMKDATIGELTTELLDLFLVMQRISKCAIMYDVNGLYKVVNNKGETIDTGNLQECKYYKEVTDAIDGYVA